MEQFRNLGLSEIALSALAKKGFKEPSPIQSAIIPFLLTENRDVVAQAQTGTGKTAAFGIPIIERLEFKGTHVKALVMVPTRELAMQVADEIYSLKGSRKLHVTAVYGGQSFGLQLKRLKTGVDIVVGTPGRILDHLRRGTLDLKQISYLVLDEADEMLDMGFIEDIQTIISHCPKERRTMLFSATIPREVLTIAKRYMRDFKTITTTPVQQQHELTEQLCYDVREHDKFEALCRIIDMAPDFYGLVFCRTKIETAELAEKLISKGYSADAIHGDINQSQRETIMRRFKEKNISILVATDVAARGIDVSNLTHVVNYAIPQDPDSYVHRIGRTGRAGKKGTAITFVTPKEYLAMDGIRKRSGSNIKKARIPKVHEVVHAKRMKIKKELEKILEKASSIQAYEELAAELLESGNAKSILAACLAHAFEGELDTTAYREISPVPHIEFSDNIRAKQGFKKGSRTTPGRAWPSTGRRFSR